jgi:hypothetical protein
LGSARTLRARSAWLVGAAAALLLAGCGGDGEDAPRESEPEAVKTVLRTQLAAVAEGDGEEACSHLTPRGRRQVEERLRRSGQVDATDCEGGVEEISTELPAAAIDALNNPVITGVRVRGTTADANVEPPADLKELAMAAGFTDVVVETRLVKAGGRWQVDHLALP